MSVFTSEIGTVVANGWKADMARTVQFGRE
jgi:hypothetical protein